MSGLGLTIETFFAELRDLTKHLDDDVANLKRSLDQGYALGPQQFKERLKQLQGQCNDVENGLIEFESRTVDATTLSELTSNCMLLYQSIVHGIEILEAHLRNYGYAPEGAPMRAPMDPCNLPQDTTAIDLRCATPIPELNDKTTADNRSASTIQWQSTTNRPLSERKGVINESTAIHNSRETINSVSTLSHDALQCSPGTLALKKKYMVETDNSCPDANATLNVAEKDSFEFQPYKTNQAGDVDMAESEIVETDLVAVQQSDKAVLQDDATSGLFSPRVSFSQDQARFGSPFRSAHKRPEKSVFMSPPSQEPQSWVSLEDYETLPQYLKGVVTLASLNSTFPRLRSLFPSADTILCQSELERPELIGDKFVVQALVKLGILERKFKNGSLGYCLLINI